MKLIKVLGVCMLSATLVSACKKDEKDGGDKTASGKTTSTSTTPTKTPPKDPPKAWTAADTQKRFTDCWLAFNARDEAKFGDCYGTSGELIITDSVPPMQGKGKDGALAIAKNWWASSKDVKGTAVLLLVKDNNFASAYHLVGTNDGPINGMPATGKTFSTLGSQMGSFAPDGTIVKDWHLSDAATMMHQLGAATNPMAPDAETPPSPQVIIAKNDEAEKANVELVKKGYDLINAGKQDEMAAMVADDVTFRWIPSKDETKSKADWTKNFGQYMSMHESVSKEIKSAWGAGDWVVAMVETSGKLKGDMMGFKGTAGKEYKTHQIEFFEIADGKVKTHWVFDNSMSMMVQIGAIDPTKMPAK